MSIKIVCETPLEVYKAKHSNKISEPLRRWATARLRNQDNGIHRYTSLDVTMLANRRGFIYSPTLHFLLDYTYAVYHTEDDGDEDIIEAAFEYADAKPSKALGLILSLCKEWGESPDWTEC